MQPTVVWYFTDTSDPENCAGNACQAMEGWHGSYPPRPHGGRCDCPVLPYVGTSKKIFRNFSAEPGGGFSYESTQRTVYENPWHKAIQHDMQITLTQERTFEIAVEEVMGHFGFSAGSGGTSEVTRSQSVLVPANSRATLTATISGTTTIFSADEYEVFNNLGYLSEALGGAPTGATELFVGRIEGGTMYESGNSVEFNVEIEPL